MRFQPKEGQIFEHYHVICVTGQQTRKTCAYCVIKPDGHTSTRYVGNIFYIEPFDGDWKDSLIEREE